MAEDIKIEVSLLGVLNGIQSSVDAGFAEVRTALAGKADKSDVEAVRSDVRHLGERTEQLERWKSDSETAERVHRGRDETTANRKARIWKTVAAVWSALMALAVVLVAVIK